MKRGCCSITERRFPARAVTVSPYQFKLNRRLSGEGSGSVRTGLFKKYFILGFSGFFIFLLRQGGYRHIAQLMLAHITALKHVNIKLLRRLSANPVSFPPWKQTGNYCSENVSMTSGMCWQSIFFP